MDDDIQTFIDTYFETHNLSRNHERVQYIQFLLTNDEDDEELTNLLAAKKRAGFRVKRWFLDQDMPLPQAGFIWVFTDFYGVPQAVAKIKSAETVRYKNFSEEMTQAIGLGDGSVRFWQEKSLKSIKTECENLKIDFNEETEFLVSWYDILYPN